jgi:hypothetical protein
VEWIEFMTSPKCIEAWFFIAANSLVAFVDDNQYITVSICLKKAESSRKEALVKAGQTWKDAMSICEPR